MSEVEAERGGEGSSGTGDSRLGGVFDASLSTIGVEETDRAHALSGIAHPCTLVSVCVCARVFVCVLHVYAWLSVSDTTML